MHWRAQATIAAAAIATAAAGCGGGDKGAATTAAKLATPTTTSQAATAPAGDVEAAQSSPLPNGLRGTRAAPTPGSVKVRKTAASKESSGISPGAPSDAEVAAELKQLEKVQKQAKRAAAHARPTEPLHLTPKGNAETPINAPETVAAIIAGGNAIARFPYVYGGGHTSFVDTAYDCSGSVSYALATAGLLSAPLTSGELSKWGAPGPGKWVTIYANAGHVFMYVAGRRFDTSGRSGVHGSRWQNANRTVGGFKVRHPPGL